MLIDLVWLVGSYLILDSVNVIMYFLGSVIMVRVSGIFNNIPHHCFACFVFTFDQIDQYIRSIF